MEYCICSPSSSVAQPRVAVAPCQESLGAAKLLPDDGTGVVRGAGVVCWGEIFRVFFTGKTMSKDCGQKTQDGTRSLFKLCGRLQH